LVSFKLTEDARLKLSFGGLQISSCTAMQSVSDEVSSRRVLLIGVLRMFENYTRTLNHVATPLQVSENRSWTEQLVPIGGAS
jgi:hypothetical protein